MSKEKLIPDLRFPEFQNQGEWEKDSIDNQFDLQDGCPFSSFDFTKDIKDSKQVIRITDINNQNSNEEKVYLPNSKIKDLEISKYEVHSGDLLLSLTGAAGFNFFIWNTYSGFINQRTMKISPKKQGNEALKFLLEPLIHSKINSIGTGQNNNLSKDALKEIEFPFPKPKEQRKLSSFLTNLNDLLAAHSQRLDLLKDHKKGLMQNLFPQEGEKVPKYRFQEFEKDGEWVETKLGDSAIFINGKAYKQEELLEAGKYRVLRVGNFFTNKNWYYSDLELEEDKYCEDGDLLYAWSASFGPRVWRGEKVIYHYHIWKVLPAESISNDFLFVLLDKETEQMKTQNANGFALLHITKGTIESWECSIPESKLEQQKIASCLSSLDALITAQAEKIEQLKWHKKGLMQGLFPKIEI